MLERLLLASGQGEFDLEPDLLELQTVKLGTQILVLPLEFARLIASRTFRLDTLCDPGSMASRSVPHYTPDSSTERNSRKALVRLEKR
ncbi:hypothetical protein [Pelagicoccus sp. SDUM812002]|uniref:hypothetical protein n=1 Tax=Pelagicoccus sp. SDUM812002 TaxID=3041266 RepID=UPI00280E4CE6|nr:hypothetical protein [Pelagicoccus sp. SDUM812002]MDQ8187795.1 hypothetical protein [Pelagicoccus sp. SDUM812002]